MIANIVKGGKESSAIKPKSSNMNHQLISSSQMEENELLTIFMEECAECIVEGSKIKRFGFSDSSKGKLEKEIGDLVCMISLLSEKGYINQENINLNSLAKREKLKDWTNHISNL